MRNDRRKRREAIDEASRDIRCSSCQRVMEGEAAFAIHADQGTCLPDGAYGQLVQLKDGRWGQRWRHPEIT